MIKKVLFFVIFLVLVYQITLLYVQSNLEQRIQQIPTYTSCDKIWASRGIYEIKKQQNTLQSFKKAFDLGATGIELDFYYDTNRDKFIISHGRPKKDKDENLIFQKKDGKLLTLNEVFNSFGKGHYFWLDYKNLDRIDTQSSQKALKRLQKITQDTHLKKRLFIEGSLPHKLSLYSDAGFQTILAFQPLPQNSFATSLSSNIAKILYYFSNVSALAMPYGDKENPKYNETTQKNLKGIPIFLFHTPGEESVLQPLLKQKDVRVILAGRDKSLNRFYLNNCTKDTE